MSTDLQKIGKLLSIQIDKSDKTNEYKDLQAKRVSLEKSHASLIGLKGHAAKVEELINLENRILELEKEIQTLGVHLGWAARNRKS
jgi:L-lactate utilization protein LutB